MRKTGDKKIRIKRILKHITFFIFYYSGLSNLLLRIVTKLRKEHSCVILLYHRIVDDRSEYLNKGPVIHHHIKDFEKEIPYLKKNYDILSLDKVTEHIKFGKGFNRPTVAITFDDGYLDNYTLAYPILHLYNVPATIYLTTGFIGTSERTWPDKIELAFLQTPKNHFYLPEILGDTCIPISTKKERELANIQVTETLKAFPDVKRRELMNDLSHRLYTNGQYLQKSKFRLMLNWDEIHQMVKDGITFGAHSHTHPILSQVLISEAKEEILKSKKIIEENLGITVNHFAFPNGREIDFSDELMDYCNKIGFDSVASVTRGTNKRTEGKPLALKRIGAVSPVWMLAGELARLFLKS